MQQKWYAVEDATADNTFSTPYTTVAKQAAVDAVGRVAITGNTSNNRDGKGIFTAKYDGQTGSLLWEQHYEGPNAADDVMAFMQMDAEGNVIVAGHSIPGAGSPRTPYWVVLKYASDTGLLLWETHWPAALSYLPGPTDMAIDPAGRVILAGLIPYNGDSDAGGGILTFSPTDGSLLREWRIPSAYHVTVCVLPSGGVAAALLGSFEGVSVLSLDEKGKEIWRASIPGDTSSGSRIRLKSDAAGHLYLASLAPPPPDTAELKTQDYLISKLDARNGSTLWQTG